MTYKSGKMLYNACYTAFNPNDGKIENIVLNISCDDFNDGVKVANEVLEKELKPMNTSFNIKLVELKFVSYLYEPKEEIKEKENNE